MALCCQPLVPASAQLASNTKPSASASNQAKTHLTDLQNQPTQTVQTQGGQISLHWDPELLRELGIHQVRATHAQSGGFRGAPAFNLSAAKGLRFATRGWHVVSLLDGEWQLRGGPVLHARQGAIDLRDGRFLWRGGESPSFVWQARDGNIYFHAEKPMYGISSDGLRFEIRSMDLRIAPSLARALGKPHRAGTVLAEVHVRTGLDQTWVRPKLAGNPNWPGESVLDGNNQVIGTYHADVFMQALGVGSEGGVGTCPIATPCDGPGGSSDGLLKLTPSSTLINNVNDGTALPTITVGGNGLGTSTALFAADVPWYEKFTASPNDIDFNYPYFFNDQHPSLIWNLYRVDGNGTLTQIARSGMKHAFATQNAGSSCDGVNGMHVLGRACIDTYNVFSNNRSQDLGPRSEFIPARGVWGRCGSIFDPECDQVQNTPGFDEYRERLLVRESALEGCRAGAAGNGKCWFEAWYLVRDDIHIYNTMATRGITPNWGGANWVVGDAAVGSANEYRLGAAIDRWIADTTLPVATTQITELNVVEGHAKVGVRVHELGACQWRYDFAVMNFDFARAVTNEPSGGLESNHTLRVLSSDGFDAFEIALGDNVNLSNIEFADHNIEAADNWNNTVSGNVLRFEAPSRAASLNWGSMLRFSVTANKAPSLDVVRLEVSESGTPSHYSVPSLKIGASAAADLLFAHGFETPGC